MGRPGGKLCSKFDDDMLDDWELNLHWKGLELGVVCVFACVLFDSFTL